MPKLNSTEILGDLRVTNDATVDATLTTNSLSVEGNILLTGDATTTNQGRLIDFTGFDKEGTTDFSDRAFIQHTTNTGGHSGSVLLISSQNDSTDGIAFSTNASSYLKHNGNTIWTAGNDGSGSGLDADTVDGIDSSRIIYGQNANKTTNVSSVNSALASGIYDGNNITGSPTSTWYTYLNMRHNNTGNNYGGQLAMSFYDTTNVYVRNINNGSYGTWAKLWNSSNDGSGSGLDADKLDNIEATSFLRSDADDTYTGTLTLGTSSEIKLPNSAADGILTSDGYRVINSLDSVLRIGDTAKHNIVRLHGQGSDDFRVYYNSTDYEIWHEGNDGSGSGLDADKLDNIEASSFLRSDAEDLYTPARLDFGSTGNWDAVGFGNLTNLHFRDHGQFWVGAGNGTWFTGTANTKSQASGLAADATSAHDLLITTMYGTSTYDRGITFAVDSNGSGNAGYRLGKWHSGTNASNSMLAVNGQIHAKGGHTDSTDYYQDDYSTYYTTGNGGWPGDTNAGWHKPSIVAAKAIQIQSGTGATNSSKPQIQFHQYGYGGPGIEYDGPNKTLTIGELGSSTSNRLDNVNIKTVNNLQVNGNTVWHAGNDGSGSGLDADKVDGLQASQFLRSDTADTASGNITFTGDIIADADILVNSPVNDSAPISVKSLSNNRAIHIEETGTGSESWQLGVDTDGNLNFFNSGSSSYAVRFNDNNTATFSSTVNASYGRLSSVEYNGSDVNKVNFALSGSTLTITTS